MNVAPHHKWEFVTTFCNWSVMSVPNPGCPPPHCNVQSLRSPRLEFVIICKNIGIQNPVRCHKLPSVPIFVSLVRHGYKLQLDWGPQAVIFHEFLPIDRLVSLFIVVFLIIILSTCSFSSPILYFLLFSLLKKTTTKLYSSPFLAV